MLMDSRHALRRHTNLINRKMCYECEICCDEDGVTCAPCPVYTKALILRLFVRGVDAMMWMQTWVVWEDLWYIWEDFELLYIWNFLIMILRIWLVKEVVWACSRTDVLSMKVGETYSLPYPPKNVFQPEAAVQCNTQKQTLKELPCFQYKMQEDTNFNQNALYHKSVDIMLKGSTCQSANIALPTGLTVYQ